MSSLVVAVLGFIESPLAAYTFLRKSMPLVLMVFLWGSFGMLKRFYEVQSDCVPIILAGYAFFCRARTDYFFP